MSIYFKGFFEIDSLDIALTLVRGPRQLPPLEIETAQPKIETALPKIETALPEIERTKYQPNERLIFELDHLLTWVG